MSNEKSSSPIGRPPTIPFPIGGGGDGGDGCAVIIAMLIIFGIPIIALFSLYSYLGAELFWLNGKLLLLAICLTLIPSISSGLTNNVVIGTFLDVVAFSACFVGSLWLFGVSLSPLWIAYGVGFITLLEGGGVLTQINMNYTLASIQQNTNERLFQHSIEKLKKIVSYGQLVYVSIPVSILAATIVGMVRRSPPPETLKITVMITFSVVGIGLLLITIVEFARMCHPIVYMAPLKGEVDLKTKLDRAYAITEVRKLYLVDSLTTIVLIMCITLVLLHLMHIAYWDSIIILASLFIVLSFFLSQIPYIIGQSLMRRTLLSDVQGMRKAEALEIMDKYMPLFPTARYIITLSTSGTAGYFIFKLLDKVFVDILGKSLGINP